MGARRPRKSTPDNPPPPAGEAQVSLRLDADNAEQDAALTAAAERVKAAAARISKPTTKAAEAGGSAQDTQVGDSAAPKRRGGGRRRSPATAEAVAESKTAEVKATETKAAEVKAADPAPEPEPAVEAPKPLVSRAAPPSLQNFIGSTRDTQEGVISRVKKSMADWAPPPPTKPDATPAKTLDRLNEDKQLMYGEGVLALRLQKALKGAQKQVENAPPKVAPAPEPEPAATPSWTPKQAPQRSFPTRTSSYDVTRPVETKEPPKADPVEPKKVAEKKPEGDKKAPYFKPITGPAALVGKGLKKTGGAVGRGLDAAYRRLPNYAANIATVGVGGALGVSLAGKLARMARQGVSDIQGEPAKEEKKQEGGTEEIPKPAAAEPAKPVGTPARKLSSDVFKKNKPAVNTGSSILRNLRGQA